MNTQKQADPPTRYALETGETQSDIDQPSTTPFLVLLSGGRRPAPISLLKILQRFRTGYRLARQRYRQRKQLMKMDDRQLKDIGITPEQAEQEACKPIWKD